VLLNHLTEDEATELRLRAARRRVVHALDAMSRLAAEITAGREPPESDELHEIARAAQRAEYTQNLVALTQSRAEQPPFVSHDGRGPPATGAEPVDPRARRDGRAGHSVLRSPPLG
jgi:hypothetical protein